MNKSNTKRPSYNTDVIKILQEVHGYGSDYIRKSIRGDRVGVIPDRIKKQYHQMSTAADKAKEEKLKEILNK